jgi:ubiquitin carboxyl-terminal hydrolase 7
MDVLDEKTNGVPPMEIDEVVSVHDRKSYASGSPADNIMTSHR